MTGLGLKERFQEDKGIFAAVAASVLVLAAGSVVETWKPQRKDESLLLGRREQEHLAALPEIETSNGAIAERLQRLVQDRRLKVRREALNTALRLDVPLKHAGLLPILNNQLDDTDVAKGSLMEQAALKLVHSRRLATLLDALLSDSLDPRSRTLALRLLKKRASSSLICNKTLDLCVVLANRQESSSRRRHTAILVDILKSLERKDVSDLADSFKSEMPFEITCEFLRIVTPNPTPGEMFHVTQVALADAGKGDELGWREKAAALVLLYGSDEEFVKLVENFLGVRRLLDGIKGRKLSKEALERLQILTQRETKKLNEKSPPSSIRSACQLLTLISSQGEQSLIPKKEQQKLLQTLGTLSEQLFNESWRKLALIVAETLSFLDHDNELLSWLEDSSARKRFLAVRALAYKPTPTKLEAARTLNQDPEPSVQLQLAITLACAGREECVPLLLKLRRSKSRLIREHARVNLETVLNAPVVGKLRRPWKELYKARTWDPNQADAPQSPLMPR